MKKLLIAGLITLAACGQSQKKAPSEAEQNRKKKYKADSTFTANANTEMQGRWLFQQKLECELNPSIDITLDINGKAYTATVITRVSGDEFTETCQGKWAFWHPDDPEPLTQLEVQNEKPSRGDCFFFRVPMGTSPATSGLTYKDGCLAFWYKPGLPPKCSGHDTYNGCMYKTGD